MIPEEEWEERASAVVRHHFDLHDCCGPFCHRKDESVEERSKTNKFYRDVVKDKALFDALNNIMAKYTSIERLREVSHSYDTNPNESMNNLVAWIAPKNKCFSGSGSLITRVSVAVCIQSKGFSAFFTTLLERLGITPSPGTEYWLQQHDKKREDKKAKAKLTTTKKRRRSRHYVNVKEKTAKAREDIRKGLGYYKNAGLDPEEIEERKQKRAKKSTTNGTNKPCKCGSLSHQRITSLQCPMNSAYAKALPEVIDELQEDANEQAVLDQLGPSKDDLASLLNNDE